MGERLRSEALQMQRFVDNGQHARARRRRSVVVADMRCGLAEQKEVDCVEARYAQVEFRRVRCIAEGCSACGSSWVNKYMAVRGR